MQLMLFAVAGLAIGAVLPLFFRRRDRAALVVGAAAGAVFSAVGLVASILAAVRATHADWTGPWSLPIGAFHLGLDPLSSLFLACLFAAGLAASIYGAGYLAHRPDVAWTGAAFNWLLASVALIFLARDGVFFLIAWEGMTLSGFLLIAVEHERAEVRRGALWYLVFNHFGVGCLFAFFALLGRVTGSSDLPAQALTFTPGVAAVLLTLAFIGFGTKMGLAPFHAWLPAAHPVAPSHVSAILSGVLLKCGAYGLFRMLFVIRGVPAAYGWVLLGCGAFTALLGAINIVASTDLKRSLAYSSIENVGIIALSLGTGVLGLAAGSTLVAALGIAGALLHVISHSVFKSLLFSAAGSVLHGAHTRQLERMGGLGKRMPATMILFLAGAASAAAIPGLAGFASEFFVYRGLFEALQHTSAGRQAAAMGALAALSLTGGLAAAGLARLSGITFSGSPRSEEAAHAHEQGPALLVPMGLLAVLCLLLGIAPRVALSLVAPVLSQLGLDVSTLAVPVAQATRVGQLGLLFLALTAALVLLRNRLLAPHAAAAGPTWGCGYAAPTARMQYSAASFGHPIVKVLGSSLHVERTGGVPAGHFPAGLRIELTVSDRVEQTLYRRGLSAVSQKLAALRALHRPRLQQHLLYVFVALVILLSYAARLVRQ